MMVNRWTEAEDEMLRDLWSKDLSGGQIATLMHKTRNSIIGRAHRMKLARRRNPGNRTTRKPRSPKLLRVKRPVGKRRISCVKLGNAGQVPRPKPVAIAPCQPPLMLGLMDISDATCRFPIGDPKDTNFGFCGHNPKDGSSYCEGHHALCYVPMEERRTNKFINYTVKRAA